MATKPLKSIITKEGIQVVFGWALVTTKNGGLCGNTQLSTVHLFTKKNPNYTKAKGYKWYRAQLFVGRNEGKPKSPKR